MTDPWRYACGRCGSQCVRRQPKGNWKCGGNGHPTPAVYDLKRERWEHTARRTDSGVVSGGGQYAAQ